MIPENIKTRFSRSGKLRSQLNRVRQIVENYPDSDYAKLVLSKFYQKFWFGSKKVTYDDIYNEAWLKFKQNIKYNVFELSGLKFIINDSFFYDFTGIFLSDKIQGNPIYNLSKEQKIAIEVLSILSTSEGPYTAEKVFLKENDIVVDAGANIGLFSIFASKQNVQQIYAFEPQKEAIEILKKNIELNKSQEKISIVQFGLYDKTEDLELSLSDESYSAASLIIQRNHSGNSEIIHCTTLDSWVVENNVSKIDFIKADIEGAERNMLLGAKNVLQKFAPKLAICTYHLPDDPEILKKIILSANPKYVITYTSHKLFAYVPPIELSK